VHGDTSFMRISLLFSKKASFTLVFLIVSVLIISSGAVIIHEIKKTDEGVAGTGLVLFDEVQHVEEEKEVGNSNSFVVYDKDLNKFEKSKKSSGNNLESTDFYSKENNLGNNDFVRKDFTEISNQIFSRNGTDYILRDDKEYILVSSNAKSSEISFNPALPSSVCVGASGNEKIDVKLDLGTVNLNWGLLNPDYLKCKFDGRRTLSIYYCLMEHDLLFPDEEIRCGNGYATTYDCETLNLEAYYLVGEVKREFTDVDLSSQFGGLEGNTIEVYATVFQNPAYDYNVFYAISTDNYKIDKEDNCQCISGSCCDLSSRPYIFKLNGSQPTGYEDDYYCSGTNSPTTTSYCKKKDYYCTGSSSSYTWDGFITDTCGLCAYCEGGSSSCFFYYQDEYCGTKDCDYLDVTCRDYYDVDKGCSGGGVCSSPSCDLYTNADPGTSCGTNKECNGGGDCVAVDIGCSLSSDCGTDGWVGSAFCYDNDVYQEYRTYDCNNPGTSSSYCSDWDQDMKKEECGTAGCSDGVCNQEIDTYCLAYTTNEDSTYVEWINNIKLNTGEKDSGSSNYSDFTGTLFTSLNKGYTYTLTVGVHTPNFYKEYVKAWIDFNNDKIFLTNEEIDLGNAQFNGDYIFEKSFTVPNNAISGETRMRVYLKYNSVPSPCENAEWGEVEDYKIKIIEEITCLPGAKRCNGNILETCKSDGSEWQTTENCGTAKYCSGTSCLACSTGYANCDQNVTNGCEINLNNNNNNCGSCGKVCASGTSCQSGVCVSSCTDECSSGQTRCLGNYKQTCGDYDADSCTEWGGGVLCQYGCSNGECISCVSHSTYKCYGDDVYWYNSCGSKEGMKQDCIKGCIGDRCKVEECEEVCSPTKCYEYCIWQ